MGAYRDNSGILLPNGRKRTDKSPDFTCEITIDGRKLELSAWARTGQRGGTFYTLSARPKRDDPSGQPRAAGSDPRQRPLAR